MDVHEAMVSSNAKKWYSNAIRVGKDALRDEMKSREIIVDLCLFVVRQHPVLQNHRKEYNAKSSKMIAWIHQAKKEFEREVQKVEAERARKRKTLPGHNKAGSVLL
ncbi:hypothetical protein CYMTET_53953 [Cymbomonas tetramitiformis]|uniref:Uncharacterized protein n=1 Tax=Cymbomonas tetramitiformis TaxID=36881 RepID=A0AAE0BHQ3_9CHLO|nr:hypothetical protein CYMTET_53953 [Cymbomonas tetramitiformis]